MADDSNVFVVDLGDDNGRKAFSDKNEVLEFLEGERSCWLWLRSLSTQGSPYREVYSKVEQMINNSVQSISRLDELNENNIASLRQPLNSTFSIGRLPISESSRAKLINQMRKDSPTSAVAALGLLIDVPQVRVTEFDQFMGLMKIGAHEIDVNPMTSQSVRAALRKLHSELQEQQEETQAELEGQKTAFDECIRGWRSTIARTVRGSRARDRELRDMLRTAVEININRLSEVEDRYRNQLPLRSAVEYWRSKAEEHKEKSRAYGTALIFISLVGFAALVAALLWLAETAIGAAAADAPPTALLIYVALGIVASTAVFWVARIFTRLYLSQHHLAIDAQERSVMAKTYLALVEEAEGQPEERSIVLASLFRPTQDGLVKDDAAPEFSTGSILSRLGMRS